VKVATVQECSGFPAEEGAVKDSDFGLRPPASPERAGSRWRAGNAELKSRSQESESRIEVSAFVFVFADT
jgi:hypothetical protein